MIRKELWAAATGLMLSCGSASAAMVALDDWGFNLDGTTYCAFGPCDFNTFDTLDTSILPSSVDTSNFMLESGLGTISVGYTGIGAHDFVAFLDHSISDNAFFNELGAAGGVPQAGQRWEIDEPGFVFGDIFDHFLAGSAALDDSVGAAFPDDVSMALGWSFVLADGETASIDLFVSDMRPDGDFLILSQTDVDTQDSIYFWGDLTITTVPEPGTLALLGLGLLGLSFARTRRSA
jgi:hypothetical protein